MDGEEGEGGKTLMALTDSQGRAMKRVREFIAGDEEHLTLGGYAGTGKTFLANEITGEIDGNVMHCAYTGKAALALRDRGVAGATTIHRLIYKFYTLEEAQDAYSEAEKNAEKYGGAWGRKLEGLNKIIEKYEGGFVLNPESDIAKCSLLMVDEFSMVNEETIDDLKLLAKKILFIGDPAQLPPVEGKSPLVPDVFLDEVVRQALDNPILRVATQVREGKGMPDFCDLGAFKRIHRREAEWKLCFGADQVLCGTNKTRRMLNDKFRKNLGYTSDIPVKRDKMVCLQNDHVLGLYNGMTGTCEGAKLMSKGSRHLLMDFSQRSDFMEDLPVFDIHWEGKIDQWARKKYQFFDYGYALTVHKSQGSEWDDVVIFNECQNMAGWLYTALTRAKHNAILVG